MEISTIIQSNCSEVVMQICGVNTDNVDEYKDRLIDAMSHKYKEKYLEDYVTGLLAIQDYHCLNLTEDVPEFNDLIIAATGMNDVYNACVSCTSDTIVTDEEMEKQVKFLKDSNG